MKFEKLAAILDRFICFINGHDWFDADGWLSKLDQYCHRCWKNRK